MGLNNFGLLGMAGAMLRPGGGLGDGFTAYQQGLAQDTQMQGIKQRNSIMARQMEMQEQDRQMEMQQRQDALRQRQQLQSLLQGRRTPSATPQPGVDPGVQALVSPPGQQQGPQPLGEDVVLAMLNAGYKPEDIKTFADANRLGMPEVARTVDTTDDLGRPVVQQFDNRGGRVGAAVPKAYQKTMVDRGAFQQFADPFTASLVGNQFQKETPVPFEYNADGTMKPGVLAAKRQVAASGAPNLTVNANKDMASKIGELMTNRRNSVLGAVQLAQSADQLEAALKSGSVISGPMASSKVQLLQLGKVLGVGGKKTDEILVNTRTAIRSLAQMDVQARKQLQGQGQVTENEAKAVAKAEGGNIDEMTGTELQLLVDLTRKITRFKAQDYARTMQSVPPELQPFYSIPGLDRYTTEQAAPAQTPTTNVDELLRKYGGR